MNAPAKITELEVGYDVPAVPGMAYEDIQTPCLILDLDALERNVKKMGDYARAHKALIVFDAAYVSFIRDPQLPQSIFEIPGARVSVGRVRSKVASTQ